MSSASRPKVSCLIRASSAFRVMLRIAVASPVRSLPALPANRQHSGDERFFAATAARAMIASHTA